MKRLLLGIAMLLIFLQTQAQSDIQELAFDTSFVFTDLQLALKNASQVRHLNLSRKNLRAFPLELAALPNLISLDLSRNRIKTIPDTIATLKALEVLNLSRNGMDELNAAIGELSSLTTLIISRNNLVFIPTSFGKLKHLSYLDLWDNNLSTLPDELAELKELKILDLRGILFSQTEHERFKALVPNANVLLSPSCNCKN